MEETNIDQPSAIFDEQLQVEYATVGQRFANYLIDTIVFYFVLMLMAIVFGLILGLTHNADKLDVLDNKAVLYLSTYTLYFIVYSLIEGLSKGRSLGKLVTRTQAVNAEFQPISWKDAFARSICRCIPFDQLSAFGGRPWHDSISKTYVIKKQPKL